MTFIVHPLGVICLILLVRNPGNKKYTGGTIFVNHTSNFIFNLYQFSTTMANFILSKHTFESFCSSVGMNIKQYITNKQPFSSVAWKMDYVNQHQALHFSGVGAHHQNFPEEALQTILNMSYTMLFHFAIHWPNTADIELWPFAVDHVIYLWNSLPHAKSKLSPLNFFTKNLHYNLLDLQWLHVFGCLVYVLDPQLQYRNNLRKWN